MAIKFANLLEKLTLAFKWINNICWTNHMRFTIQDLIGEIEHFFWLYKFATIHLFESHS